MFRKYIVLFCIYFLIIHLGEAQTSQHAAFVQFKSKPSGIFQPEEALSKKAIERRQKWQLTFDETDKLVDQNYIAEVLQLGGILWHKSKWLNGILIKYSDKNILASISKLSCVQRVTYLNVFQEPRVHSNQLDEETIYDKYKGNLTEIYKYNYSWLTKLNALNLVQQGYDGSGRLIAVIDAGFHNVNKHYSFRTTQILATQDFLTNDNNVYNDDSHGTDVLSCMASVDSGQMVGMAPKAQYILLRTEDALHEMEYEEILWTVAAEYADSCGADLINSSLGYNLFDKGESHVYKDLDGKTTFAAQAAQIAAKKGIWVFVSAGNEGNDPWHHITTPADAYEITTVGACNFDGKETYFSSAGPTADGRMSPVISAPGMEIYTANSNGYRSYHYKNGSSFSTPMVCGLAACLMQKFPDMSVEVLQQKLYRSCTLYPDTDHYIGYGMPQFDLINLSDSNVQVIRGPKFSYNIPQSPQEAFSISYQLIHTGKFTYKIYVEKNLGWMRVKKRKLWSKSTEGVIKLTCLKSNKHYRFCLIQNDFKVCSQFKR